MLLHAEPLNDCASSSLVHSTMLTGLAWMLCCCCNSGFAAEKPEMQLDGHHDRERTLASGVYVCNCRLAKKYAHVPLAAAE